MKRLSFRLPVLVLAMLALAAPVSAQKINVKSATPDRGAQATVDLEVLIDGSGFGQGARAEFFLSGTENPDGIRVKNTRFVSSTQLVATIDIAETASPASFDIKVTLNARTGKGTDLFQVVQKINASVCTVEPLDTSRFQLVGTLNGLSAGAPLFEGLLGADVKLRRVTLAYPTGSREVLWAAVTTGETSGRIEIFFLDPTTGVVLDGTAFVSGEAVQPHVTITPGGTTWSGGQLAMGDVNGDGLPDLVSQHNGGDRATLFLATRASDGLVGYTAIPVPPPAQASKFAFSTALGDLTGDGRDEIVVSNVLFGSGKNVVYPEVRVYGVTDATPVLIATAAAPEVRVKTDYSYGVHIALGDVTGDGLADVLVAAPRWKIGTTSGVGAAFLHAATGGPDVISSAPIILTGPAPAAFDHFANRVGVANVDGSGPADLLALDAWGSAEVTGDVFAGPILATGQTSNPLLRIAPRVDWTTGWGNRGVAIGDLDGNGLADLVIGAPNAPDYGCNSIGIAFVYLAQGTTATGTTGWTRYSIQPPTTDGDYSAFGWSAAVDVGSPIVLIGERDRDLGGGVAGGQVYVYRVIP